MRKILFVLLCFCGSASPAVTLVQVRSGSYSGGTTSFTAAFTNNTAGNIGVINIFWCSSSATTITGVTDTSTNIYTLSAASLATVSATHFSNCYSQFAYTVNLKTFTGTNTVTAACSGASICSGTETAYELTAGVLDQTITGTNANTATPTPGSITTGTNGSFFIASGVLDDGYGFSSGWFTAGSGFTLSTENGGGNLNGAVEHQAQTTAGAITASFGSNFGGVTGPNAGSMITFKPAGGGSSFVSNQSVFGVGTPH